MLFYDYKRRSSTKIRKFPYVVLRWDNWDDYGYRTSFHATLHTGLDEHDLGVLKILKIDQTGGQTVLPGPQFTELGEDYCSLGCELEYYETLFKLGPEVYEPYLNGLQDVVFHAEARDRFEDHEGFEVSLLRSSMSKSAIVVAEKIFGKKSSKSATEQRKGRYRLEFQTRIADDSNQFTVKFDFRDLNGLPNRLNVLVGYNGSGKTRLLSNLATALSGYGYDNRTEVQAKARGKVIGSAPPFGKVIVVSYSAFDTFAIPGKTDSEKERLRSEGNVEGYVYCGLRDLTDEAFDDGSATHFRLRSTDEIEAEFDTALARVRKLKRTGELLEAIRPLLQDASFQRIGLNELYGSSSHQEWRSQFQTLSSGHKIVLKIIVDLISHIDGTQPSLVLIDEPETHLHPPLLAALLRGVRAVLDTLDGYAVVATHSPVVLQETPSRFVRVLQRVGNRTIVGNPKIETFGESIGLITQEVFNLDDGATDWHATLQELATELTLREIEELFENQLGFGPRSFIISLQDEEED